MSIWRRILGWYLLFLNLYETIDCKERTILEMLETKNEYSLVVEAIHSINSSVILKFLQGEGTSSGITFFVANDTSWQQLPDTIRNNSTQILQILKYSIAYNQPSGGFYPYVGYPLPSLLEDPGNQCGSIGLFDPALPDLSCSYITGPKVPTLEYMEINNVESLGPSVPGYGNSSYLPIDGVLMQSAPTIYAALEQNPNVSEFLNALIQTELDLPLRSYDSVDRTLLVPSNAALDAFPFWPTMKTNTTALVNFLLYHYLVPDTPCSLSNPHCYGARMYKKHLKKQSGNVIHTLLSNTSVLTLSINETTLFINDARIETFDIICGNGVVHLLDRVLLPDQGTPNVVTYLQAMHEKTLYSYMKDLNLLKDLSNVTLFLPWQNSRSFKDLNSMSKEQRESYLRYMISPGKLYNLTTGMYSTEWNNLSRFVERSLDGKVDITMVNGHAVQTSCFPSSSSSSSLERVLCQNPIKLMDGIVYHMEEMMIPGSITIWDYLEKNSNQFSLFIQLIEQVHLSYVLQDPTWKGTVFLPSNAVFHDFQIPSTFLGKRRLVQYHFLPGNRFFTNLLKKRTNCSGNYDSHEMNDFCNDICSNQVPYCPIDQSLHDVSKCHCPRDSMNFFETQLDQSPLSIQLTSSLPYNIQINNHSTIQLADITSNNGVIHHIHQVLVPSIEGILRVLGLESSWQALEKSGLIQEGKEYTLFAPTDAAFLQASSFLNKEFAHGQWEMLLMSYHLIPREYPLDALVSMGKLKSSNGKSLSISINEKNQVFINNALVLSKKMECINGFIYIIDTVLFPPLEFNLHQLMTSASLNMFLELSLKTGLLNQLESSTQDHTLFIPSDQAFAKMNPVILEKLGDHPIQLVDFLSHHIVYGKVFSPFLSLNHTVTTLKNSSLGFHTIEEKRIKNDRNGYFIFQKKTFMKPYQSQIIALHHQEQQNFHHLVAQSCDPMIEIEEVNVSLSCVQLPSQGMPEISLENAIVYVLDTVLTPKDLEVSSASTRRRRSSTFAIVTGWWCWSCLLICLLY